MFKKAIFLLLPVAAATGPVAYYSGPEWFAKMVKAVSSDDAEKPLDGVAADGLGGSSAYPLEGPAVPNLMQVLRFDLTPAWVVNRWPRVSTGLAQLGLQGYRVPLVTGTAEHDLAGALTYYFTHQQHAQRITFEGTTGDYRRLVQVLSRYYGFVRRPTNSPGVFLYEVASEGELSRSYLWIEPAGVLKANEPYHRFQLRLVLERPTER